MKKLIDKFICKYAAKLFLGFEIEVDRYYTKEEVLAGFMRFRKIFYVFLFFAWSIHFYVMFN